MAIPFFAVTGWLVLGFDLLLLAVFVAQDPFYSLLGLVLVAGLSAGYLLLSRVRRITSVENAEFSVPS